MTRSILSISGWNLQIYALLLSLENSFLSQASSSGHVDPILLSAFSIYPIKIYSNNYCSALLILLIDSLQQQNSGQVDQNFDILSKKAALEIKILITNSKSNSTMLKEIIPSQSYYAIEMDSNNYPFGQLKEAVNQEQLVLVRKTLAYQSQRQLDILNKMALFLSSLDNTYLIALHHTEKTANSQYIFFYEYAPLALQKWILDLGNEIMEELYLQMLNLTSYLTQNGIKFKFDPSSMGLSKDIKLKYFLSEFSFDNDKKISNYKQTEEEILQFFTQFRQNSSQKSIEDYKNSFLHDRKSADCVNLLYSVGTRESWQIKSNKSSQSAKITMSKNTLLNQKIQSSKKISLDILQKLRNSKLTKTSNI